jgi:hypothetical protein
MHGYSVLTGRGEVSTLPLRKTNKGPSPGASQSDSQANDTLNLTRNVDASNCQCPGLCATRTGGSLFFKFDICMPLSLAVALP